MKINPDKTPEGVDLKQVREILTRDSKRLGFFHARSNTIDIPLIALPGVYLSREFGENFGDSGYFAEKVPDIVKDKSFLEIGCGTGLVSIAVALRTRSYPPQQNRIVTSDINPNAVRNTRINVLLNNVERMIGVREGYVFSPIDPEEKFDYIFWNHPFHSGKPFETMVMRAGFDPKFRGLEGYVRNAQNYLTKDGTVLLGTGNFADLDLIREIVSKYGRLNLLCWTHKPFKGKAGEQNTFNIYKIEYN